MVQSQNQQARRCHHCGSELTGETSGGLCPRCLLEMNFASRTMPEGEATPQVPPPSPEEIAERFPQFEILECLGRGGMGIVYKARQKALDRLVAIKVLAGERHDDPQFEARFSREARTLAKLSHPNIVTVHDFGESDGMFYLVMEFVDGVNLRDVLRDGRMEPAQALAIVPSICEALQFAHEHGVVHRDIKPENILMDRDGRVKIADFGIATLVGAAAEHSGTPPYMAPEQEAADGAVDHRADIYALGVVFYEMLTGERPEQDPSRPSQRVEIDVRLDEIVLRALEKEPEQRYQTAGEFRTVLETMATPASPTARRQSAEGDGRQFASAAVGKKYNPWEATIVGLGTMFFVVLISYAWELSNASFTGICIVGLCICVLSLAGIWPFSSPFFPDPNFSSRNTRRCKVLIDRLRHVNQRGPNQESDRPHPSVIDQSRASQGAWQRRGIDRRSKRTLFGLPLWHVATGMDPGTGRMRTARGIVAIGDRAQGVVAIGGVAMGVFAFGGFSIGVVSIGGFSAGLFVMGGFGLALIAAFGGFAMAPIAFGGMAVGWYAFGGLGLGAHVTSAMAKDPEAVRFFDLWAMPLMTTAGIAIIAIIAFILLLGVGLPLWMQRQSAPPSQDPTGKQRRTLAALVGIIAFMIVGAGALLCWLQRPRLLDDRIIAADSPDGMYSAMGDTWHAMRIFGGDRAFYRFIVQGKAGVVSEKWNVEVPNEKLATSYVLLSIDEILFGKHGRIVWSDDNKRASFQVHGVEVAGFDADAGKPTDPDQTQNTPEQAAREHMEAIFSGDVDRALSALGPPWSETREDIASTIWRLQVQGKTTEQAPELVEWHQEGPYAVTSWKFPPRKHGSDRKPYLVLERFGGIWRVVWGNDIRADASQSEILGCFKQFRLVSREDPEEVAREFIAAFGKGDADLAEMLTAPPLSYQRDELARAIAKASQAQGASGRKPASPLGWHQDGPYAVTRARLLPAEPEMETYLVFKRTGKIWRVVGANISSPDASLAENLNHYKQETFVGRVTVEDLALRFLVAIREQDEETLRELCVDRTKGWTEALVGPFSLELRERFRQSTGEEFALYPGQVRVRKDLAVIQCLAFKDVQKKLNGNILVLHFCRTAVGWKVWSARKAPESQALDEHLEQAREWAAEWEKSAPESGSQGDIGNSPEQVAAKFMAAIREQDIKRVRALLSSDVGGKDLGHKLAGEGALAGLVEAHESEPESLTNFTEWHREKGYAVTRTDSHPGEEESLYLILSFTPNGWRVCHAGGISADASLAFKLEQAKRLFLELDRSAERRRKYGPSIDMDAIDEKIAVEDTALHFLVAIREKDEAKMRKLCIDHTKGWTDALVGHFSMELRERFRQSTGEEFTLYPGKSLVDGSLAVVQCVAAKEMQAKLKGKVLVLHFNRTAESGWKNWTLRTGMDSQPLAEHLEQARKWAADWKTTPQKSGDQGDIGNTPEPQ